MEYASEWPAESGVTGEGDTLLKKSDTELKTDLKKQLLHKSRKI